MAYGKKIHKLFEMLDLKNIDYSLLNNIEKKTVMNFISNPIFDNINNSKIFKEYEFEYEDNHILYKGTIDLMLVYENYIDIIDYKLSNIDDEKYIDQLNGYKKYIEMISNKKVNIYLYSILKQEFKKIN